MFLFFFSKNKKKVASVSVYFQFTDLVDFLFLFFLQSPVAQMRAFWDSTGQLWQAGSLVGKPVTAFTSSGTLGGGQEVTILGAVSFFVHQGMVFVPPGYSYGGPMFDIQTVHGGSPWGAGTFAGPDGSRQPSETELGFAKHQGSHFLGIAKKLSADK